MAGLSAGLIATLTITVSTQGLLQLFPGHVPPIVNSVVPPGTSAADILANNEIEANDPYMAVTIVGFLLAIAMAIVLIRRYSVQSKANACATAIALADPSGPASRRNAMSWCRTRWLR